MKAKLIIAMWLISLMFMATDNPMQEIIALCFFGLSSWLLKKCDVEAIKRVIKTSRSLGNF